ncbi:methylated-DNA--[protein]-cysteine S-methyltransferase [Nocardia sp. CA-107356]|uniref:methylated-DNA--[protein]-cysteine S-methyltransferase n=1 Tax=Nocardia sp. CA-107356 TaxID=3239972 RepID=UPI003D91DAC5
MSAFDREVLLTLEATTGYGWTTTYGALTRQLGRTPADARKIGGALARNRLLMLLPCHRVLGADGALTGYAGGLPAKRALLDLESADLLLPLG